ncbi:MAG TPA: dihydrofolate reductase, partial [Vicinamibacterales bacterium]|nr:dihydrofolate reductase [Vicinamibacterales bacterium]
AAGRCACPRSRFPGAVAYCWAVPKPVNLIAAVAENRVIGRDGRLPWRIREDWDFFRRQTAGQIVVLGRISFESWKSIFDDDRRAIVITRDTSLARDRVHVAASLEAGLALAETLPGDIYVCGGQRIFEDAITLPQAARLYLTLVHAAPPGDRFFPEWAGTFSHVLARREGADERHRYTFLVLARDTAPPAR